MQITVTVVWKGFIPMLVCPKSRACCLRHRYHLVVLASPPLEKMPNVLQRGCLFRSKVTNQVAIRIVGILLLFLHGRNGPLHATRASHTHRVGRNVLGDRRTSRDRRAFSNLHARQNDHIAANPAIVLDGDRVAELDEFAPRQDADVMTRGEDADVGTELHAVADEDQTGVQGGETDSVSLPLS